MASSIQQDKTKIDHIHALVVINSYFKGLWQIDPILTLPILDPTKHIAGPKLLPKYCIKWQMISITVLDNSCSYYVFCIWIWQDETETKWESSGWDGSQATGQSKPTIGQKTKKLDPDYREHTLSLSHGTWCNLQCVNDVR